MRQNIQTSISTVHSSGVTAEKVCAVVVTYFPDTGLAERLKILLPQVATLIVVDNTPTLENARQILSQMEGDSRIYLVENKRNSGIAAALNQGLEHAFSIGSKWLLTLDQDSRCYPDMVETLLQALVACNPKTAVIGGNYYDSRSHQTKISPAENSGYLEQKTVITSGCLIDVCVARELGGFREDFFIDQVDHEFCLRARTRGYRVAISRKPVMDHSVGREEGVRLPLLGVLPNHPPLRKYYIARNTLVIVAKYWQREPGWCMRRSVRLLLGLLLMATLEKQRLVKIHAFAAGIIDGVRHRMGPCEREWLYHS